MRRDARRGQRQGLLGQREPLGVSRELEREPGQGRARSGLSSAPRAPSQQQRRDVLLDAPSRTGTGRRAAERGRRGAPRCSRRRRTSSASRVACRLRGAEREQQLAVSRSSAPAERACRCAAPPVAARSPPPGQQPVGAAPRRVRKSRLRARRARAAVSWPGPAARCGGDQRLADASVEPRAAHRGQPVVQRRPHQRVRGFRRLTALGPRAARCRHGLLDQPGHEQLRLQRADRLEHVEVERPPDHGTGEHPTHRLPEPRQRPTRDRAHAGPETPPPPAAVSGGRPPR